MKNEPTGWGRVARWFIFQTKNPNSGKFLMPWNGIGWYIQ
jgi:hypothetical protein